ncbi:hypothetical protein CLOBL_22850 [Clostridium sp. BL-8]|nr:hypothetical protein CLOBL_22850 [Clostridium sp. BL-8]
MKWKEITLSYNKIMLLRVGMINPDFYFFLIDILQSKGFGITRLEIGTKKYNVILSQNIKFYFDKLTL